MLELLLGLIITSVVLGFTMKAVVETNTSFEKDKQDLMVNQTNLSLLQIVGDNIKEAGENIGEPKFPAIEISVNTDADAMTGSSKLTIRKAVVPALELCDALPVAYTATTLRLYGYGTPATRCVTSLSQVTPVTNNLPSVVTRSIKLTQARKYRCSQDNVSVDYSVLNTDFCEGNSNETSLAFISDKNGNYRTFDYTGDTYNNLSDSTGVLFTEQLNISNLSASFPDTTIVYPVKSSIYIIQERTYTLSTTGIISVEYDRSGVKLPLLDKVRQFKVAAKAYSNKETQEIDAIDGAPGLPTSRRCISTVPTYICEFNTGSTGSILNRDDWKTLAAVRVTISAAFDTRGRNFNPTAVDLSKLEAASEFFPRNVLSR